MAALPPYLATIQADWIDYNGHLRDAYYGLVLSYAIDDVMEHLGLNAAYRVSTHCTLYTLELHLHYLHEVKGTDALSVQTSVLDADAKRFLAGCTFTCPRVAAPVAVGEVMLLHVRQAEAPASAPFPPEIAARLQALTLDPAARAAFGPRSRQLEIKRRGPA